MWRIDCAVVAGKTFGVLQADGLAVTHHHRQLTADDLVGLGMGVGTVRQRRGLVQQGAAIGNDLDTTHRIVSAGALRAVGFGNDIRAVECVVERAPARIGGVERIASVLDRHHQLRAGDGRYFGIDIGRVDGEIRPLGQQVSDFLQEFLVLRMIVWRVATGLMPGIDGSLQLIALEQQDVVLGREFGDDILKHGPEGRRLEIQTRQHLIDHQLVERRGDFHAAVVDRRMGDEGRHGGVRARACGIDTGSGHSGLHRIARERKEYPESSQFACGRGRNWQPCAISGAPSSPAPLRAAPVP